MSRNARPALRPHRSRPSRHGRRPPAFYRPWVERLEDRTLLTFGPPTPFNTAPRPSDVAVGDFNNDGLLDLVTANASPGNSVSVLLGNGDGTFQQARNFAAGANPTHLAVGDLNGDGNLDVVTGSIDSGTVTLLLGNGDGTLLGGGSLRFSTVGLISNVALADLNADDRLDLVATITNGGGFNRVSVALGNGNGTFRAQVDYEAGFFPEDVAFGDYNRDGILDMAVAESGRNVRRFTGNGDGTFQPGVAFYTGGPSPFSIVAADFNGDGILDVAVHDQFGSFLAILAGNGNGTFQEARLADARAGGTVNLVAGDVNGDGNPDLIAVNRGADSVSVLLGNGDFTFRAARIYAVASGPGARPSGAALGDFNGDGFPDLAVANTVFDTVAVLLNDPTAVTSLRVTAPAAATPGVPFTVTVTALTSSGEVATGYRGTVRFTSTDPFAALPANYTFTADDNGTRDFTVTLGSPGSRTVAVTDTADGSVAGSAAVTATAPAAPARFVVTSFPSPAAAGAVEVFRVTAVDALGSTFPGYRGTVRFTSSDPQATLPFNYTFTADDGGTHTFGAVLRTAGPQTITVTDVASSGLTGSQTGIVVNSAAASTLVVSGFPTAVTAGAVGTFTVTARDAFGNVATGYRGTARFTSSDGQATLPGNYTFTAADNGTRTFGAMLRTAGTQTLTATDTATGTLTGAQAGVTVNAAAASGFLVSGFPASVIAGSAGTFTATAKDPFGNTVTGYRGTVRFTSSDNQATLPGPYTFTAADNGSRSFSATLRTAGTQTLTATDAGTSSLTGTQAGIAVSPAAVSNFLVAGFPSPVTAGDVGAFTVTARDAFGNTAPGYRGTVRFGSNDGQATLPNNYTFTAADNGTHAFGAVLRTSGTRSLTATDTASPAISGTQGGIVVNAVVTQLTITVPSSVNADTAFNVTVTARDAFGSVAASYRGTVQFTSTDPLATLPGSYTFTAADAGTRTFSVTLRTTGSQTVTVRDAVTSTLTASAMITVNQTLFAPPVSYASGPGSWGIAHADFNGDGFFDLVTATNPVSVLINNGDGTFRPAVNYPISGQAWDVAIGDFNGDGKPDLVTANLYSSSSRSLLFGNGDGTFQPAINLPMGDGPNSVVTADFDGDGYLDLVHTHFFSNRVSFWHGNGDGTFRSPASFTVGSGPYFAAVADLDNDGRLDVVAANSGGASILYGNGDGTFQPFVNYPTGNYPFTPAVGDFNRDGILDIVVSNNFGSSVGVLIGNGDRTFRPVVTYAVGQQPVGVSVGDVDGDGILDIVVSNSAVNNISLLRGIGDGRFQPAVNYTTAQGPGETAIADLDGDGALDLAVSNGGANTVSILLNALRPPAAVRSVTVNDGSAQRSQVTSLTVAFNSVVALDADAFELRRQDGSLVGLSVTVQVINARTVAVLTFVGDDIVGGFLADGNYTLVIRGDRVRDRYGRALDGDADGTPGGDRLDAFFRLYGDTDGDRDVDEADQAVFDAAFGRSASDPGYLWFLDFDGDGFVGDADLLAFTERLGTLLPP